jgi:anti-anti-sigma factor
VQNVSAHHPRERPASICDARKRAAVYLPITTRQLADGTVEISPSGEIDLDNAHVMRDAVNDVLTRSTPERIGLDLQRVMLIDSIGIGILVACFHVAAASGVKLVVSHPSATVYRQLWVSGLVGLLGCAEPPAHETSVGLRPV